MGLIVVDKKKAGKQSSRLYWKAAFIFQYRVTKPQVIVLKFRDKGREGCLLGVVFQAEIDLQVPILRASFDSRACILGLPSRQRNETRGSRSNIFMFGAVVVPEEENGWRHVGWRREREGERHLIIVVAASLHMTFDTSVTPSDDDDSDAADAAVANDCKLLHRRETCIPSRRPRDPTGWSKRVAPGNKCL